MLTSSTGKGSIPPGVGSNGTEKGPADGTPQKPFEVYSEFELTVTTIAPATSLAPAARRCRSRRAARSVSRPVGDATMSSAIALHLYPAASDNVAAADRIATAAPRLHLDRLVPARRLGTDAAARGQEGPEGRHRRGAERRAPRLRGVASGRLPKEVAYNQVEAGPRKPLPFVTEKNDRARVLTGAKKLADLLPSNIDANGIYTTVRAVDGGAGNSRVALVSLRGDRAAPPRLGALGERMAPQTPAASVALATPDPAKIFDLAVKAPIAIAVLAPLARRETKARAHDGDFGAAAHRAADLRRRRRHP